MGQRLDALLDHVRRERGPFFVARVALRARFPTRDDTSDTRENEAALVTACRELGYDPSGKY